MDLGACMKDGVILRQGQAWLEGLCRRRQRALSDSYFSMYDTYFRTDKSLVKRSFALPL
jgi:hypothetical protein